MVVEAPYVRRGGGGTGVGGGVIARWAPKVRSISPLGAAGPRPWWSSASRAGTARPMYGEPGGRPRVTRRRVISGVAAMARRSLARRCRPRRRPSGSPAALLGSVSQATLRAPRWKGPARRPRPAGHIEAGWWACARATPAEREEGRERRGHGGSGLSGGRAGLCGRVGWQRAS